MTDVTSERSIYPVPLKYERNEETKMSMWHNPWTGAPEYDVSNHGPGLVWNCDCCGEQIIEDDTCPDCNWTLEEQEG